MRSADSRSWRERLKWPLPIALAVVAAVCIPLGAVFNVDLLLVIGIPAAIFALVLVGDATGYTQPLLRPPDPAEVRVKKLVEALSESTKVITQIEREVKARGALAERLQADIERNRGLLQLNAVEVEAVAQTFRSEVRTEGRRSLLANVILSAFFFALGIVVTILFT
jgi:hypothetical protein